MPWRLVWRYLAAHPFRSLFTMMSMVAATFLLCLLQALLASLDVAVLNAAKNRLIVQSAVSLFVTLPHSYQGKIEAVDGVEDTCKWTWFGGYYQDPENFFAQFGADPGSLRRMYPEMEIIEGSYEEFERKRTGCVIGDLVAQRFSWEVGQTVPLIGTIYPRVDRKPWEYEICAIYTSNAATLDRNTMFFHHDYLDESIDSGSVETIKGVGVYAAAITPGVEPTRVMADIDALFENGPQVVQTTTEAEFNRQFVSMLGNVPALLSSIGASVLFAILLATLNTMIMAGRERTHHIGILKALGFGDGTVFGLLIAESMLVCALGGALGVFFATGIGKALEPFLISMFPGFAILPETQVFGLALAASVGLLAGILPAWQAMRLRPVDALRAEV